MTDQTTTDEFLAAGRETDNQTNAEESRAARTETDDETVSTAADTPAEDAEQEQQEQPDDEQQETFPREYVEKLRKEAAGYRDKAKDRDQLAQRLHTALVAATGRLQDASDLPYDPAHLEDADALTAALDDLLDQKPYLASRRVVGDVGQGATDSASAVDLAGILRARAS